MGQTAIAVAPSGTVIRHSCMCDCMYLEISTLPAVGVGIPEGK